MWHFNDKVQPQSFNFHFCILEIQVVLANRILGGSGDVHKQNGRGSKVEGNVVVGVWRWHLDIQAVERVCERP